MELLMKFSTLSLAVAALALLSSGAAHATEKKPVAKIAPVSIDANNDGNISLKEAQALAAKQFSLYDRNKDGSVDMKEYRVPFDALAKAKKFDAKKKQQDEIVIKESFTRIDSDKNGKISKAEFMNDSYLRHKTLDANGDGQVTPKEIEDLQKKIETAHREAVAKKK